MSWTQLILLSIPHSSLCSFPIFKISLQLWLEDISIWGGKKNSKKPTKSQNLGVEFDTLPWFLAKVFWIEKYFHVFYSSKSLWNHHLSCKMIETMWCFKCTFSSLGNFSMERRNWSLFCKRWCSNSHASSIRSTDLSRQSKEDVAYQP